MYCSSNCNEVVGYINLVVKNEDQEMLLNETNIYDQVEFKTKRWIQRSGIFYNSKNNIQVFGLCSLAIS